MNELDSLQELYKDDGSKDAEIKQQISQKMILLRSTLPKCHYAAK